MISKSNLPMYYGASAKLFHFAREMRKNPTAAEQGLWLILYDPFFDQYKFRRQHPIAQFIADFYCHSLKLVIEVDGGYHLDIEQKEFDSFRDEDMNELGISVIRVTNEEVISRPVVVKDRIIECIVSTPKSSPRRGL